VQIREQIRLRPPGDRLHLYRNYLVLSTGLDGFVSGGEHGLFVHEARVVSDYRYLVDGVEPRPIGVAAVSATGSVGYYVALPPGRQPGPPDAGSGLLIEDTQWTLELVIRRSILPPDADAPAPSTNG
jgi:hypothetical protein